MIPPTISERIERIRDDVRNERAAVADLGVNLTDLKQLLEPARLLLDDVQTVFLSADVLKEPRTAAQWNFWLDNAERGFASAVRQREHVGSMVEKYGADARIVAG